MAVALAQVEDFDTCDALSSCLMPSSWSFRLSCFVIKGGTGMCTVVFPGS